MRLAEIKARRLNGNGIIHGAASEGREGKKKKKNFSSEKMAARRQAGNDASPSGAAAAPPSRDPGLFRRCHDRLYFWPDASVIASHSLSIGLYLLEPPPFPSLPFPASSAAGLIK